MSNEIVPEAVVDTPSVEDTVTQEVITDPNVQPNTTETETPTPPQEAEVELSEEELDAAIEAILKDMPSTVVTEPTFFPGKEEINKEVNALDAMIDEFTQSEATKAEALQKVSEAEVKNQELSKFVEDITTSYAKISDVLGTDIADKITAGETDIPLHLYSDKMEKVYAHPFFGPHIKTILAGGEVDLPKLLRESVGRARIPNVADTPTTKTPEIIPQSTMNSFESRLRSGHRLS